MNLSKSALEELSQMVVNSIADKMINKAQEYLLLAKNSLCGNFSYTEIALKREIFKLNENTGLSKEDYLIDQLAFICASINLDK